MKRMPMFIDCFHIVVGTQIEKNTLHIEYPMQIENAQYLRRFLSYCAPCRYRTRANQLVQGQDLKYPAALTGQTISRRLISPR